MTNAPGKLRSLIFIVIAIVFIPAALILCLEAGLRLSGYGFNTSFLKAGHSNGTDVIGNNPEFSRAFFTPKIAAIHRPMDFEFPARKPAGTFRIFVLGESAAVGYPAYSFSFSRILEVLARHQFPDVRFEIINTAFSAINSHTILQITKDLAPWEADLYIVYMGNNEVVGPYGPGTIFSPLVSNLWLLRTVHYLKSTRTGQLLADATAMAQSEDPSGKRWGGMEMFFENRVRADDVRMKKVYAYFQRNLQDILRITKGAGAQTIVCTLGSNLKGIAPFASLHHSTLSEEAQQKWHEIYQTGVTYETAGNYAGAIQQYKVAAQIDDDYADLHFRLGRCYQALSDHESAKESFIRARDLDTLRFRPDTQINDIIRSVASGREHENIYLVDAESVINESSAQGIADDTYFYEHVHFNFDGNYLLAKAIFGRLQPHLPAWVLEKQNGDGALLTREECATRLAYTGYNRLQTISILANHLMDSAPFTNMINHADVMARIRAEEQSLEYFSTPEGLAEAEAEHRKALELNPLDKEIHLSLGGILLQLNRAEEAEEHFRLGGKPIQKSTVEQTTAPTAP